ncbi:hypothetical protein B0H10DRAFT_2032252 [Mycena sp. CBHHK59/15]|nr:hypothetical protein B0H10DRAFT_2032252 [Mycena sp. CBHHK59/15]
MTATAMTVGGGGTAVGVGGTMIGGIRYQGWWGCREWAGWGGCVTRWCREEGRRQKYVNMKRRNPSFFLLVVLYIPLFSSLKLC